MNSRHRAREVALQILYRHDVATHTEGSAPPTPRELISDLSQHFDHWAVPESLREFSAQLVAGSLNEKNRLDELLEKHAANWTVARMGFVDRSLLRMAAYELLHMPESPPHVVIDEAVELAKQFGTADTPAFINGILDSIKAIRPDSSAPSNKITE